MMKSVAKIAPAALCFLLFFGFPAAGQKFEKEERVRRESFPDLALAYLERHYPGVGKARYYREVSADTLSFEAKFHLDRHLYSVEFYSDGRLMDVEKKINFGALPEAVRRRIEARWSEDFQRSRVMKCQEQTADGAVRYEIEVRGKTKEETAFFQYLFEADGAFVERETILPRSTDMNFY